MIHTYTREQAIEDGQLVDVSETPEAKEAGFQCSGLSSLWACMRSCRCRSFFQRLAGLQRAVVGHTVPGCSGFQAGRGEAPRALRSDLSDRSAPVRYGHALALFLGI